MKKLLATLAIAGTLSTGAVSTAQAGDAEDVVKGIIGVVILNEILNPGNHKDVNVGVGRNGNVYGGVRTTNHPHGGHVGHGGHHGQQTVIINNHYHRDCGYVQNVYRDHGVTRVVKTDRCTGRILEEKVIYN
jgi:hypothetical protein